MRYIALLRGINVTGKNMIKMDTLRATFEALGFKNVKSYINSGNLAFDTSKTAEAKLIAKVENAIEKDFGLRVQVMVRERGSIENVLRENPFDGEYESHKQMHVFFMRDEMPAEKQRSLMEWQTDRERFAVNGREIFALLLDGVAESTAMRKNVIEGKLKVPVTARNWRTVERLAEL
jgi:uncharacterized protein (DUF1697 family)